LVERGRRVVSEIPTAEQERRDTAAGRSAVALPVARWRLVLAQTLLGGPVALVIPAVAAVLLFLFPVLDNNQYWIREISLIAVLALVVSGVNLSFGYAGEIQFGQVFMFAFGCYLTMAVATRLWAEIIPLLLIGGMAAALVGAVVAVPAVRIGGWALALASFFLVITIPDLVSILPKYTGGLQGLFNIATPKAFGSQLSTDGLYRVTIVTTVIWFAIYRNLVTSRYGVIFRILRQSPVLANSLGFSTGRLKIMAYALGAFPAGMAGCLFGFISLIVTPLNFSLALAIGIVAGSILGGIESVYGVFIAATVLQLGPQSSLSFAQYAPVAYGAFLMLAAIVFRHGLGGLGKAVALRLNRLLVGPTEAAHSAASGSLSAHVSEHPEQEAAEIIEERHGFALPPLEGQTLRIDGLSKAFGGVKAVNDVSVAVEPGRVTALIGPNGSGKTTVLNLICGHAKADSGQITFGTAMLTNLPPHRIAPLGVGRTFQTPSIPRGASAVDVVSSGRFSVERCGPVASVLRLPKYWRSRRADRREALLLLELVGLTHVADSDASSLSLGQRRMIEVARALCSKPKLLLLDEPASGLSEEEVVRLGRVITAAARAGATVVLIEHNFSFVSSVADVGHVLEFGKVIASGSLESISKDPQVIESFLGEAPDGVEGDAALAGESQESGTLVLATNGATPRELVDDEVRAGTGPLLELSDAVAGYGDLQVLRGVSLAMERGKVEVLLGRNGVGKTTLLGTITGQNRLWKGSLILDGQDIRRMAAHRRAAKGIALVQEGKRIFRERTILDNVVLGTFALSLSRAERRKLCDVVIDQFPILKERSGETAGGLSGGQQQMLAIAQALASRPRLLLLDEPSAGLAPAIVIELFQRVRALSEQGMTILLVEQLAEQALAIADHVTVLDNGRVVAAGPPEQFRDQRSLHEAYFGDTPAAAALPITSVPGSGSR
jgi:branched-chain amino acid transport system permease protein